MNKLKKEHVDINCFSYEEDKYQAKLKAAILSFNNDPQNYDRVIKPTFLVWHYLQEAALEGMMLSKNHQPFHTQDGFVLLFEGDKYKEGLEALPALVKSQYELELEEIKNKQKSILEEQIYQQSIKAELDKAEKADEKKRSDAKVRADKYFAELS